uniref:Uncharacterized protein n=1 Tax=Globodera pallida TaxID=36090 RepID=A0A183C4G2_GLOPA
MTFVVVLSHNVLLLSISTNVQSNSNFELIRIVGGEVEHSAISMSRLLRHPRQFMWIMLEAPKFESRAMDQIKAYHDLFDGD